MATASERIAAPATLEAPRVSHSVKIRPRSGWQGLDWKEIWAYRELLYFIVWRAIKVRYKQTVLGAAWAVLQPLLTMVVFSVFFGHLAKIPSDGVPYPVFAFTGLLPWVLFTFALTQSAGSLVSNQQLLTKVYFPRVLIPVGSVLVGLVDFAIGFVVLFGIMAYFGILPTLAVVTLPLFVLLALATALGVGLWLSALNVQYRDVGFALPFLSQLWLLATPIAYPSSIVPERWRALLGVNPMVGVVEGFRWALLGKEGGPGAAVFVSIGVVIVLLAGGLFYFRRVEKTFADVA